MVTSEQRWTKSDFVGGHPALDFLNTVGDPGKSRQQDKIAAWPQFCGWLEGAGLLDRAGRKTRHCGAPDDPQAVLTELHQLRAQAYGLLSGLATGATADHSPRQAIERRIRAAMTRAELVAVDARFAWRAAHTAPEYWPDTITLCLESLLRSEDLQRVRQCARCTWLFIDSGRGAGRRWCDMRTCGNRAKAEAFRRR